ncbi:TonB-dependent receptor domain-containing protein [Chryseobacterium wanjuense]
MELHLFLTKAFPSIKGDIWNYAKLTASYTKVGNATNIGIYAIDPIGVFPTGYPFGDLSSYIRNQSPTSLDITPEFPNTVEGGLNLGLFKDRITIDASVYSTKTKDLITFSNVSNTSGISRLQDNIGDMTNKGFDIDLGLIPFKSRDFEWKLGASYTTYKTEITDLYPGIDEVNLLSYSNPAVGIFAVKGEKLSSYQRNKISKRSKRKYYSRCKWNSFNYINF